MEPPLNLPEILKRIDGRLSVLGLSATGAAKEAGKPDAIRNIRRAVESGARQGVSIVTLAALAPVLKTTVMWLMTGRESSFRNVPLVGLALAGGDTVTFADAQGPFDEVDAPDWATDKTVAVQIRGTSLGRLLDGWIAFYDDRRDPPDESLHGRVCICGLTDGRVVIKKLRQGSAKALYHLESENEATMFDVKVEWAAAVREMRPR